LEDLIGAEAEVGTRVGLFAAVVEEVVGGGEAYEAGGGAWELVGDPFRDGGTETTGVGVFFERGDEGVSEGEGEGSGVDGFDACAVVDGGGVAEGGEWSATASVVGSILPVERRASDEPMRIRGHWPKVKGGGASWRMGSPFLPMRM
jgi:hypothetical protein